MCIYLLRVRFKKDQQNTYSMMLMRFYLIFLKKAYVVGTHNICLYKVVETKVHLAVILRLRNCSTVRLNLGVCVVIRSSTVISIL